MSFTKELPNTPFTSKAIIEQLADIPLDELGTKKIMAFPAVENRGKLLRSIILPDELVNHKDITETERELLKETAQQMDEMIAGTRDPDVYFSKMGMYGSMIYALLGADRYRDLMHTCKGFTDIMDQVDTMHKVNKRINRKYNTHCAFCDKRFPKYKCTGCNKVYYCTSQCQKSHWKNHKQECKEHQAKQQS